MRNIKNTQIDTFKKVNWKENSGITLIALIITIIVLIILAGISITSLTGEKGLINQARNNSENAQRESIVEKIEADLLKEKTKTGNTPSLDDLKKIIEENEYCQEGTITDEGFKTKEGGYDVTYNEIDGWKKILSDIAKPGDYVSYTPDAVNSETINDLISDLNTYSGSSDNSSSKLQQESLNWRVLDIQGEQVRLICENPTTSTIALYGAKGYNNAVYLIDKVCEELYSSSKFSVHVQNLKIEDIEDKLTYDYTQHSNPNVDTGKYGGFSVTPYKTNTYYPSIYAQEKNNGVSGTKQKGILGLSEQQNPINESYNKTNNLSVTQTYWHKAKTQSDFKEEIYYNLYVENKNRYWLSSRCVGAWPEQANFHVYYIVNNDTFNHIFDSTGTENLITASIRPVITLNSNSTIEEGDGQTPGTAYKINV